MDSKRLVVKGNNIGKMLELLSNDIRYYDLKPAENIYIFMSEKYYFRNNSQLMVCLILKLEDENNCVIDIVAGGGGQGLLSSTWGAEISRIKEIIGEIENICMIRGWEMIEE
ncbi:hypothetical protein RBU61_14575 [Tissierella sp. MB52-C2]|uniref:hypothetical protein n=1 Tax=Tissierella sp. MB52-C2 TaxID=3070999 RepID=UPI00280A51EE|nr:hypothetical protein [Tissierella sp. MB52-C2]WMM24140.1 hypothetical protein RBU61_14575 [Tissierella sp. MB52-C2]